MLLMHPLYAKYEMYVKYNLQAEVNPKAPNT